MDLPSAARGFVEAPRFAVLATINRDGSLQQTVVWYELCEGVVLMNTRLGRLKDRNLRRRPYASICVEEGYRFVSISGAVTLVDDREVAQADIERLATRYNGPEKARDQVQSQFSQEERVTVLLSIDKLFVYGM